MACPSWASFAHFDCLAGFSSSLKFPSASVKERSFVWPSRSVHVLMSSSRGTQFHRMPEEPIGEFPYPLLEHHLGPFRQPDRPELHRREDADLNPRLRCHPAELHAFPSDNCAARHTASAYPAFMSQTARFDGTLAFLPLSRCQVSLPVDVNHRVTREST